MQGQVSVERFWKFNYLIKAFRVRKVYDRCSLFANKFLQICLFIYMIKCYEEEGFITSVMSDVASTIKIMPTTDCPLLSCQLDG